MKSEIEIYTIVFDVGIKMKDLKIGTLCSGIGSPEEALKRIGIKFNVVFASDIDKNAKITYLSNHSCDVFYDDIYDIPLNVPRTDLMIVGFPCQPFSLASSDGKGLEDDRGKLIYEICRIIKSSSPKYIIAENVEGLVLRDNGETFKKVLEAFNECGYNLEWKILNSLDFGVPQHRRRVYIVGIKKGSKERFDFNDLDVIDHPHLSSILDKKVDKKFFATKDFLSKDKVKRRIKNYNKDYAPCITQTIARNGSSSEYISQVASVNRAIGQNRKPTPRECARLHGFPDSFVLPENVSITKQYEQFANTMTVNVIEEILKTLLDI